MKSLAIAFGALVLAACSPPADINSAQPALEQANAAYDAALLARDAEALAQIYTDDFTFIGDNAEQRDKAAQIAYMTSDAIELLEARSTEVEVTMLGADAALVTGRLIGRFRAGGEEHAFTERYTSVWRRDGAEWRLRHEHSSLEPPN